MRITYITPKFLLEVPRALEALGHVLVDVTDEPEAIICMSVSQMEKTWEAVMAHPEARLYVYNWDVYDWSLKTPRENEYDWASFKRLCQRAQEVWVPSVAEAGRYERWTGEKAFVLRSAVPFWNLPDITPRDNRFVLDTLRETPDPFWGLAKQACADLGIPFVASKHGQGYARYARLLATCTMTVSTLREASTGGFGLVEAAWYGKPCLVPNNPENAGSEYVPASFRFAAGNLEDLKEKIKAIWENPQFDHRPAVREQIREVYSAGIMAAAIDARLRV